MSRTYRERSSRIYDAILSEKGLSGVTPLPELREVEPDIPPECRGALWDALSVQDQLALVAAFKGWRTKRADPKDQQLAELERRCAAGEFKTLDELEAAWRRVSEATAVA